MDDRVRLAELVCARLCHDLSGLLASLTGTLDLLAENVETDDTMTVALDAAVDLTRRLRLLRAAWAGMARPLTLSDLTSLAEGAEGRHIHLDVSRLAPDTIFAPAMGRLVLNLLLLAADSLPRGGTLHLDGDEDDLVVRLDGPQAAWPAGLTGMLVDEDAAWDALGEARGLQAPLTALLAHADGLVLSVLLVGGGPAAAPPLRLSAG